MAELAALSVAANVAQFACYGLQCANYLHKAYKQTEDFKQDRERIDTVAEHLETTLSQLEQGIKAADDDKQLAKLVELSIKIVERLTAKQEKLKKAGEKDDWLHRALLSVEALRSRGDIERLLEQLVKLRDEITHHLVVLSQ